MSEIKTAPIPVKEIERSLPQTSTPKWRREVDQILAQSRFGEVRPTSLRRDIVEPIPGRNLEGEDYENTKNQLQFVEENSTFLELDHPLTRELQGVLDRMQDPNSRKTRLLIALNETESNAYCLPDDTIVLNMSLIHDMDYVEEVVAVLAHEQSHSEKGHAKVKLQEENPNQHETLKQKLNRWLASLGHQRKGEYQADFRTLSKLDSLGYDSMALASAVRKIGQRSKSENGEEEETGVSASHGSGIDRALNTLYAHAIIDFPSSAQGSEGWHRIPDEWRIQYKPSITEQLRTEENIGKWWEMVTQATPGVLTQHIQELTLELRKQYDTWGRDKKKVSKVDNITKVGLIFTLLEKRLADSNLTDREKKRAVLLGLTEGTGIDLSDWQDLHYRVNPKGSSAIIRPISYQSELTRAAQINIEKYTTFIDKIPEGFREILDLHANPETYSKLGLLQPKSEYPSSLLDSLWNTYWQKDNRKKAEGELPENVTLDLENLLSIEPIVSERFGKEAGGRWLNREIHELVRQYINTNVPYDNLFGYNKKLLAEKTAQLLGYVRDKTGHVFTGTDLSNYAREVTWGSEKEQQYALNLFREKVYRPDPKFESIITSQNSEELLQYLQDSPERFQAELALTCNKRSLTGPQRQWLIANLSLDNLAQVRFNQEINLPQHTIAEISKLPFDSELQHFSDTDIQTFQRLMFAAEASIILTAGQPIEIRRQVLERFLADEKIIAAIESLPLALNDYFAGYVMAETVSEFGGYKSSIPNPTEAKFDMDRPVWPYDKKSHRLVIDYNSEGDRLLRLIPFQVLRSKLTKSLDDAHDLAAVASIHSYFNGIIEDLYQDGASNLWGVTGDAAEALSPFLTKLFDNLSTISLDTASPAEITLLYEVLEDKLPKDIYNTNLLGGLLNHIALNIPFEEALTFLEKQAVKRRLDFKTVEIFVENRVRIRADYLKCKDSITRIIDRVMEEDSSAEGKLVLADVLGNAFVRKVSNIGLLKAMMMTSQDDGELRKTLALPYWYTMAASSVRTPLGAVDTGYSRGWEVVIEGKQARVVGPAAYAFQTFNDLISRLYRSSGVEKNLILRKMFFAKNGGIFETPNYHSQLAEAITSGISYDEKLTPLFRKTLTSALKACDPVRIFHPLAGSLSDLILKPSQGSPDNSEAARELHGLMHEREGGGKVSRAVSYLGYGVTPDGVKAMLDLTKSDVTKELLQERELTRLAAESYERVFSSISRQLGLREDTISKQGPISQTSPIEVVMQVGQAMGPVGKRFLQVLGQYIELDPEYQEKFREVYDSNPGQSKYTAFSTIERLAKSDEETRTFLEDELVSIDEKLGGGSIMTTFKITTRDSSGQLKHEVLKIKNPNAERFVLETVEQAELVLRDLLVSDPGNRANYEIAQRLLLTIREWVLADINDTRFISQDEIFTDVHDGFVTSEGVRVDVPKAAIPHNLYLKREELVPGRTLNQVMSESDSPEGRLKLRRAVRAEAELFARSLTIPALDADSESPKYLVRSDIHPGNDIISETGDTLYPIDRNFYLVLEQQDIDFFRRAVSEIPPQEKLAEIVRYALGQPENQGLGLNPNNTTRQIARTILSSQILGWIRGNGSANGTLQLANRVLHELDRRGIKMPLRTRLLFKNLDSVNHMLKQVELGSFSQYLL